MREIKFRVWEKTTKNIFPKWGAIAKVEMDECGKITQVGVAEYTQIAEDEFDWNLFEIKNEENNIILMQYTGLKDKNGKEIYEGDILETYKGRRIVEYEVATGFFGICVEGENPNYLEVIGNIYENPELLRRDV